MSNVRGWRAFERNNEDVKKAEILKVPLDRIQIQPHFNPRDMGKPETQAKIANIKEAYKGGRYVKPIEVRLAEDGDTVVIVDGECRFTAALQADRELREAGGLGLAHLVVVPFTGNDADQLLHTITGNEGEKLTPLELSNVVKRLIGLGWDRPKIAAELNYSLSWVDQLVFMGTMPEQVKGMVSAGKVAPDVAAAVVKQAGAAKAAAELATMVEENGGTKVTAKHLKQKKAKEAAERGATEAPDPAQGRATEKAAAAAPSKAARKAAAEDKPNGKAAWPFKTVAETAAEQALELIRNLQIHPAVKKGAIKDDLVYAIEVPGAVMRQLVALQKR